MEPDAREVIEPDNEIISGQDVYVIEGEPAYGGSCIVYRAKKQEDLKMSSGSAHITRFILIKELFPKKMFENGQIYRDKDSYALKCTDNDEFNMLKDKFREAYGYHIRRYQADQDHTRPPPRDIIETNNTLYTIHEYTGASDLAASTDDDIRFYEVAEIMLSLCNAIGWYHRDCHLYLDIKPDNILLCQRAENESRRVELFDFDTVQPIKDIREGTCNPVRSEGWSPKEQMEWDNRAICAATDIYAIGAVFFWLLTGKKPVPNDLKRIKQNKPIKRKTKYKGFSDAAEKLSLTILRNTLQDDISKRYQNISDLRNAFESLREETALVGETHRDLHKKSTRKIIIVVVVAVFLATFLGLYMYIFFATKNPKQEIVLTSEQFETLMNNMSQETLMNNISQNSELMFREIPYNFADTDFNTARSYYDNRDYKRAYEEIFEVINIMKSSKVTELTDDIAHKYLLFGAVCVGYKKYMEAINVLTPILGYQINAGDDFDFHFNVIEVLSRAYIGDNDIPTALRLNQRTLDDLEKTVNPSRTEIRHISMLRNTIGNIYGAYGAYEKSAIYYANAILPYFEDENLSNAVLPQDMKFDFVQTTIDGKDRYVAVFFLKGLFELNLDVDWDALKKDDEFIYYCLESQISFAHHMLKDTIDAYEKGVVAIAYLNLANIIIGIGDTVTPLYYANRGIELLQNDDIPISSRHPIVMGYNTLAHAAFSQNARFPGLNDTDTDNDHNTSNRITSISSVDADNLDEVIELYEKAIEFSHSLSIEESSDLVTTYFGLAFVKTLQMDFPDALGYYLVSLRMYQAVNDTDRIPANYVSYMKSVYMELHQDSSFDEWLFEQLSY